MLKAFAITVGLLLIIAGIVILRTGVYKDVAISAGEQGPFVLVYKSHVGPYHKIVPVIESVETFFKEKSLPCPLAFGRYLDNPDKMDHDRLRSQGGCAFTNMSEDLQKLITESGFEMELLDKKEYLVATFDGSPSMGPFVVYPKVMSWLEKYGYSHKGPIIEIYQTREDQSVFTRYLFEYSVN